MVPSEKRRLRMLLAKVVQNIANAVNDFKEDSMMPVFACACQHIVDGC